MQRLHRVISLAGVVMLLTAAAVSAQTGATGRTRRRPTPDPTEYTLTVQTSPGNASVAINGQTRSVKGSSFTLQAGTYSVRVSAPGYPTVTEQVTLDRDRTIRIDLSPQEYTLQVRSNVNNADVYIDGSRAGSTNYQAMLEPGQYEVEVRAAGYQSRSTQIDLEGDRTLTLNLDPNQYTLQVRSNVSGATVYIDGSLVGTAAYSGSLSQGEYSVRVSAPGYRDYITQVDLSQDRTVNAELQQQNGTIQLNFPERTANVFYVLDGNRSPVNMRGPSEEISLSPGTYTFQYNAGGISSPEFEIEISAGETMVITPSLQLSIDTQD